MDDEWHGSIAISLSNDPANLVTVQDSGSHVPLDASQLPNHVSMDSNQGAEDSLQDSKCDELDSHAHQLSPTAGWGHTNASSLASVQPNLNSTLAMGNVSQLIHFSNGSNENNSPPGVTTMGNDPLFPSVTDDVSSVPENANHCSSSKSRPSDGLDVAATNIAPINKVDNAVSTIDNWLRLST